MNDAHELLSDCPNCRTESAVVELIDPSIAEGVSVESRCRLCGREEELGEVIFAGRAFDRAEDAHRALAEWASADGSDSVDEFCRANLGGLSADEVTQRLLAGEVIESNFDVVAYLFPSMTGGRGGSASRVAERVTSGRTVASPWSEGAPETGAGRPAPSLLALTVPLESEAEPVAHADRESQSSVMARALSAVMVADSRIRLEEIRYLVRTLDAHGLPRAIDEDIRPWRPADLSEPEEPRVVIRAMVGLAFIDRHRDHTEWRVIREFARYWRVPMSEVEAMADEHAQPGGSLGVLWRGFRSLFVLEA